MATSVEVVGEARFNATASTFADDLDDLEPANRAAVDRWLQDADPRTPRESGQLAASGQTSADQEEGALVYDAPYSLAVAFGTEHMPPNPWVQPDPGAAVDVYVDHIAGLARNVKGA